MLTVWVSNLLPPLGIGGGHVPPCDVSVRLCRSSPARTQVLLSGAVMHPAARSLRSLPDRRLRSQHRDRTPKAKLQAVPLPPKRDCEAPCEGDGMGASVLARSGGIPGNAAPRAEPRTHDFQPKLRGGSAGQSVAASVALTTQRRNCDIALPYNSGASRALSPRDHRAEPQLRIETINSTDQLGHGMCGR